ncbi:hypothetical protein KR032_007803, partial [Drosophila birchii]
IFFKSSASGVPARKSKLLATLLWMLKDSSMSRRWATSTLNSFCMCDWGNMLIMLPVSSTTRL